VSAGGEVNLPTGEPERGAGPMGIVVMCKMQSISFLAQRLTSTHSAMVVSYFILVRDKVEQYTGVVVQGTLAKDFNMLVHGLGDG